MSLLCSIDVAGRRRSPATTAEFHLGRTPGNKGIGEANPANDRFAEGAGCRAPPRVFGLVTRGGPLCS